MKVILEKATKKRNLAIRTSHPGSPRLGRLRSELVPKDSCSSSGDKRVFRKVSISLVYGTISFYVQDCSDGK